MIPRPEDLAEERRELRRLYAAAALAALGGVLAGWAIDTAFTWINAARIAGGW